MRAQSHVIGAALMIGLAVVALAALTVGVGSVLESQAAGADADRMATTMSETLEGVEQTGAYSQRVDFAEGRLTTEERTLRIFDGDGEVSHAVRVDALVFESGDRRVTSVAGAVIRGEGETAWLDSEPPVVGSAETGVLYVGAPVLGETNISTTGAGGTAVTFATNVSHDEVSLGTDEFTVAIETETPEPLERFFEEQGATIDRQQFEDDTHESVLAQYPDEREGYLIIHDLALEVRHG